jgi:hypothetical protein
VAKLTCSATAHLSAASFLVAHRPHSYSRTESKLLFLCPTAIPDYTGLLEGQSSLSITTTSSNTMSWFSGYDPSVSWETNASIAGTVYTANPAALDPLPWPAHDIDDGLDLPTFDLYLKIILQKGARSSDILEVLEQKVSVGRGLSFNVLRRSHLAIRKYADKVEFQGSSRVSYAKLKPFIQELLVLHHPYLQKKEVLVGLVGCAWDIKQGLSDMLTIATPVLDLEFAEHGNLAQYLKSKPLSQSLSERRMLCHQILSGLSCLHDCQIVSSLCLVNFEGFLTMYNLYIGSWRFET